MRDIKFRVWDLGKMVYLNLLESSFDFIQEQPVMQYTGLKDKNGVEIYEGDVVKVIDGWGNEWTSQVTWGGRDNDDVYPAFDLTPQVDEEINSFAQIFTSGDHTIEVIGDIYQNKELLNEN